MKYGRCKTTELSVSLLGERITDLVISNFHSKHLPSPRIAMVTVAIVMLAVGTTGADSDVNPCCHRFDFLLKKTLLMGPI